MGFPITAQVVGGGRHEAFPVYAWFIDRADGPVWQEMDAAFDEWHARTGPHVAFFVDPFQRDEWAAEFLGGVLADRTAVRSILDARSEAQRFFRERLADRACRELWLPADRLPLALVSCRWDARTTLAVPLAERVDVGRLLDSLVSVAQRLGPIERIPEPRPNRGAPPWRDRDEERRLRELEQVLEISGFEHRRTDIRSGMARFGQDGPADEWSGPFAEWLRERASSAWTGAGSHLAGTVTRVAMSSFDDLLLLARSLIQGAHDVARRHPSDAQAADIARYLPAFIDAVRALHAVRHRLLDIVKKGGVPDEQLLEAGAAELLRLPLGRPDLSIEARIVRRLGAETFTRLQPQSRAALLASEAICALSEAISELHHDLSAVLLGYWKASEIEGRKLIVDLITYAGGIPVWNERVGAVDNLQNLVTVQRSFTAGSVGHTLVNARFEGSSAWCGLPLAPLGERYQQMATATRNRFIHRDNLQDAAVLSQARSLVAEPPNGILPMAIRCMGQVAEAGSIGDSVPAMVVALLESLEKGNASAAVPKGLAGLEGRARAAFAQGAVTKLGERWLREPKRVEREWVVELFDALPRDDSNLEGRA